MAADQRVTTLPAQAYWRLRFLQADAEKVAVSARFAQHTYDLALREVARQVGFDPTVPYRWDDEHTALVAEQDGSA